MSWNVGDKLVRVKDGKCSTCTGKNVFPGVKLGTVYEFAGYASGSRCGSGAGIKLDGVLNRAPHIGWCPAKFRKIRPDEREECEPEFVTLLKRIKIGVEA